MSTSAHRAALRSRLEELVLAETGALAVVRSCSRCASPRHGRPALVGAPGLHLSLAYAAGLAVAAWSRTGPVGIDVEPAGPPVPGVGDLAEWTRTEATAKATGLGLLTDPAGLPALWTRPLDLSAVGPWVGHLALGVPPDTPSPDLTWRWVRA